MGFAPVYSDLSGGPASYVNNIVIPFCVSVGVMGECVKEMSGEAVRIFLLFKL